MTEHADWLQQLQVPESGDLRTAMESLHATSAGAVFVVDPARKVLGMLTDGDIRRAMLKHGDMGVLLTRVMNRNFVWVAEGTPKQRILKLLDGRVRVLPILDGQGRLIDMVRAGYQEPKGETYARSRAPVRLSLAGGGTDFTNYFVEHGGVSLCATINKHAHAIMRRRPDRTVRLYSHDLGQTLEYATINDIPLDGQLDLIKAGLLVMRPDFGFDLSVSCDYGIGTGLGGSAALLAAVLGCLNEYREDKLDSYAIAEMAFEAERVQLGIPGGWQDQYSTVFGGFNFIEFDQHHNTVMPLRLQTTTLLELEERFLICFSGRSHLGHDIQTENQSRDANHPDVLTFAREVKAIAYEMRQNLLRGNLTDFGRMLDATWQLKKSFSRRVSNERLDHIYDAALAAGAEGGRLLGTGGGGYFLFFVKPFRRYEVMAAMAALGLECESVTFDSTGQISWMSRE